MCQIAFDGRDDDRRPNQAFDDRRLGERLELLNTVKDRENMRVKSEMDPGSWTAP